MIKRHYPRGLREEMILRFESLSPKMRYIDFAKQNNIKLENLKTWIYDSRKKKTQHGIVEIKTKVPQKNPFFQDALYQTDTTIEKAPSLGVGL